MAGAAANRGLIKKQCKDEHGSRNEQGLNFARSRTVSGLRHVGGVITTPGHPSAGRGKKIILLAKDEVLQVKCNQQSVSSWPGDAAHRETQTFSYIIPIRCVFCPIYRA